jgi:hypothetical protein
MANATTTTEKPGLGDLAEIFYAPSAVFARRTEGEFGVPYVALVILGLVIYFATRSLFQPIIDSAVTMALTQANAKRSMSPDEQAKFLSITRMAVAAIPIIMYVVAPFLVGLFVWVVGKLAKASGVGSTALVIATFSLYPRLVGSVAGAILAAALPEASLTSPAAVSIGPARFVDPSHVGMAGLLGRFDLFTLWGIVLIAIGMQAAAKATKTQAWITAAGVWVIGSIPAVWGLIRA